MENYKLLCRQCRNIFIADLQPGLSSVKEVNCPKCGSGNVQEAPAWAPLGSGANIFEGSEWEYECQECKNKIKMPIPKSPAEDKSRRCPLCGSGHLHVITDIGARPLYCG